MMVFKVCMTWLCISEIWTCNVGGRNHEILRVVGRRKANFSHLRMPKIKNQNFCHYCEVLFCFALLAKKWHKAMLLVLMYKNVSYDYWLVQNYQTIPSVDGSDSSYSIFVNILPASAV